MKMNKLNSKNLCAIKIKMWNNHILLVEHSQCLFLLLKHAHTACLPINWFLHNISYTNVYKGCSMVLHLRFSKKKTTALQIIFRWRFFTWKIMDWNPPFGRPRILDIFFTQGPGIVGSDEKLLFNWMIFRFHINFQRCIYRYKQPWSSIHADGHSQVGSSGHTHLHHNSQKPRLRVQISSIILESGFRLFCCFFTLITLMASKSLRTHRNNC